MQIGSLKKKIKVPTVFCRLPESPFTSKLLGVLQNNYTVKMKQKSNQFGLLWSTVGQSEKSGDNTTILRPEFFY